MTKWILTPEQVTLKQLSEILHQSGPVQLDPACRADVDASSAIVARAAEGDTPVYGVNTGFGKLASVKIAADQTALLQRNLILSHACGVGEPLSPNIVRLIMSLKLISFGRGASGVRWALVEMLEQMLAADVIPIVPGQGSVGASGDLAPLAHIAAVMIGEGEAYYQGQKLSGGQALQQAGLNPVVLAAKEGLALINGTQVSTALALSGLFLAEKLCQTSMISGALSVDAAMGSSAPFRAQIHHLRGHRGQQEVAASLRDLLAGSEIRQSHLEGDERVQDPYCLRCQPQVLGACLDLIRQAGRTLEIEANAATDNPLIFIDEEAIVSGGNFHAEPVAFAADQIALALSEMGSISQRRIATLVDPALNFGLPAFLSPNPGVNSGYMIADVTSAALYAENKQRAVPCSIDSTPTSANQEDHVSMATHGARRLQDMSRNLAGILGIEILIAIQGIEMRAPLKTSASLQQVMTEIRAKIPALAEDRYLAPELTDMQNQVFNGQICQILHARHLPTLQDNMS